MSEETFPKYKDPIWHDKSNRAITCRIHQGDGEYAIAQIVAANGENADYDAVLEMYGEEEIDRLTAEHRAERIDQEKINKERALANQARHRQEVLFNMKLEAFEVEEIKNSTNRELKKRLRKSKTIVEVQAFATLLIQDTLNNAE